MPSLLNPAPEWVPHNSVTVSLWHGCTNFDRLAIERDEEVKLSFSRLDLDFGRGFYTTTQRRQAEHWAVRRFDRQATTVVSNQPMLLKFTLNRADLARLTTLHFVLAGYGNEDYWSLVQHCRQSKRATRTLPGRINDHAGPVAEDGYRWFDLVSGPVVGDWKQRSAFQEMDQFSFHTTGAVELINQTIRSNDPGRYSWLTVTS